MSEQQIHVHGMQKILDIQNFWFSKLSSNFKLHSEVGKLKVCLSCDHRLLEHIKEK